MQGFYGVFIEECDSPYSSITEEQKEVIEGDWYEHTEDYYGEPEYTGFFRKIPASSYHWVSTQIINELEMINGAQSGRWRISALPNGADKEKDMKAAEKFLQRLTTQKRKDSASPIIIIPRAILGSENAEEYYDAVKKNFNEKVEQLIDLTKWYLDQISDSEKTSYSHTNTIKENGEHTAKREGLRKTLVSISEKYNISNSDRLIRKLMKAFK